MWCRYSRESWRKTYAWPLQTTRCALTIRILLSSEQRSWIASVILFLMETRVALSLKLVWILFNGKQWRTPSSHVLSLGVYCRADWLHQRNATFGYTLVNWKITFGEQVLCTPLIAFRWSDSNGCPPFLALRRFASFQLDPGTGHH